MCVVRGAEGARQREMDDWCVSCRQTADRPARGILQGVWNSHSLSVCPAAKTVYIYVEVHGRACSHTHTQKLVYYHSLWLAIFGAFYNHSHPHLYHSMAEKTWLTKKKLRSGWIIHATLGGTAKCSLKRNSVCQSEWIMKTLFSRCISSHYFQNATKAWMCACVCVCDYADRECSSCRVQRSRLDTVNVGRSPGCWIMDQRRTRAQPNAAWSDVTVISTDWCRPRRPDSPAVHTGATCMFALTHQQYEGTALFVTLPWCTEKCKCLRADSYSVRYNLVMNPVAHLVWLRFLLHIPGRCQGPHRRQRSLPKSQPCYTDECVSCSVI